MHHLPLTSEDMELIRAAEETLRRAYVPDRHTVAAAVRAGSGRIYTGVNIEGIHGPCAEPVALGNAFAHGERNILAMVAVHRAENGCTVLSPCGNCRQLILEYAPDAHVILVEDGRVVKAPAHELLPGAYHYFDHNATAE
jgi:cytidine deaminase